MMARSTNTSPVGVGRAMSVSRGLALIAVIAVIADNFGAVSLAPQLSRSALAATEASNTPTLESDVEFSISGRTTEVGVPITLQVTVRDAAEHAAPTLPNADGTWEFRILPGRNRSESVSIINGRTTRSITETYRIEVTAAKEGIFPLPPIRVVADGTEYSTPPVDIEVKAGAPVGDLASAVVESSSPSVWLGQATSLELVLTLRAPAETPNGRPLSAADMWSCIDLRSSEWGPFTESMMRLVQASRVPHAQVIPRGGETHYVYRLPVEFFADKSGVPDLSAVRIRVNYPLELATQRTLFGTRLVVSKERPITLEPTIEGLEVLPLPAEGRPASFTGAVGDFEVLASARPAAAAVGDPITLTFVVKDRGGTSQLQSVAPPNLAATPGLAENFDIPDAIGGGTVQGDVKVFTQTLRPLHADVSFIPPIEFSWFNPERAAYQVATTAPIPIDVRESESMDRDAIVGRAIGDGTAAPREALTREPAGAAGRHDWRVDALLSTHAPLSTFTLATVVATPPILCAAIALVVGMRRRAAAHPAVGRRKKALPRARAALASGDPERAIAGLVEDRTDACTGTLTPGDVASALRAAGAATEADEAREILDACAAARFASRGLDRTILDRTSQLLPRIARQLLLGLAVLAGVTGSALAADPSVIDAAQAVTASPAEALAAAHDAFDEAEHLAPTSPEAARIAYGRAATLYQRAIDAGASSAPLYLDLGNALQGAGDAARARAAFVAGRRLDPGDARLRQALRGPMGAPTSTAERLMEDSRTSWQSIPTSLRWGLACASWLALWAAVAAGVLLRWRTGIPWRLTITVASVVSVAGLATILVDRMDMPGASVAVVSADGAALRTGNGESFARVPGPDVPVASIVNVVDERPAWVLVQVAGGREGWIPATSIVRP